MKKDENKRVRFSISLPTNIYKKVTMLKNQTHTKSINKVINYLINYRIVNPETMSDERYKHLIKYLESVDENIGMLNYSISKGLDNLNQIAYKNNLAKYKSVDTKHLNKKINLIDRELHEYERNSNYTVKEMLKLWQLLK